jgi:hypothetical protein
MHKLSDQTRNNSHSLTSLPHMKPTHLGMLQVAAQRLMLTSQQEQLHKVKDTSDALLSFWKTGHKCRIVSLVFGEES